LGLLEIAGQGENAGGRPIATWTVNGPTSDISSREKDLTKIKMFTKLL
jgi:hypothetical protein